MGQNSFNQFYKGLFVGLASLFGGLIVWQAVVSYGVLNVNFLPPPSDVFISFIGLFQNVSFVEDIYVSVFRVLSGFLIGATLGIITASATSYISIFNKAATPWIEILRPIPPLAWIPIAILFFGLGDKPAIFLVSLGSFFPVYTSTYYAIKMIPVKYLQTAKVFGANTRLLLSDVVIPAILPRVVAGLKIGLGISWMIVITAELVGATSGLGYFIELNRLLLQVDKVIVGMAVIGLIGFSMNGIVSLFEKNFSHYNETV